MADDQALGLFRRLGRRGLRLLRPLGLPLMHRVEVRARMGVEGSSVARDLQTLVRRINPQTSSESASDRILAKMAVLQVSLDVLREDQRDLAKAVAALTDRQGAVETLLSKWEAPSDDRMAIPLGENVLMRSQDGFLLAPAEDIRLLGALWTTTGRLEPGTVRVLCASLAPGDTAIDVGAHIGLTSIPMALAVGAGGKVHALEPGKRACALLRDNLALSSLSDRVTVHEVAAGSHNAKAKLHVGKVLGEASILQQSEEDTSDEVDVCTLDSLVAPGTKVRLVKLDAEGYEPEVWRGMQRVVADNPSIRIVVEFGPSHLRRAGFTVANWFAMFAHVGFTGYEIDEASGALAPLRSLEELQRVSSLNVLFIREAPSDVPELRFL